MQHHVTNSQKSPTGKLDTPLRFGILEGVPTVNPYDVLWLFMYRRIKNVNKTTVAMEKETGIARQAIGQAFAGIENRKFGLDHVRSLDEGGKISTVEIFRQLADIAWDMEKGRIPEEELRALKNHEGPNPRGRPVTGVTLPPLSGAPPLSNAGMRHGQDYIHTQPLRIAKDKAAERKLKRGRRSPPTNR